jgi:AraC-like DNA-binding protein
MTEEKIYLENELNLSKMAEKLGVSVHDTSFLINQTQGHNFYTYVNSFRIEAAKKLLRSSQIKELNILGIAFASGFNSKTTFNTTFKKITGLSPSQYTKQAIFEQKDVRLDKSEQ